MKIYTREFKSDGTDQQDYIQREIEIVGQTKHLCFAAFEESDDITNFLCGIAIEICYEEDGKLHVENGEYKNPVLFCPFCGFDAKELKCTD